MTGGLMFPIPDQQQRKCEADRFSLDDEKIAAPERLMRITAPRIEIIEHQPRELYRPPHFLTKTATPQQVADLECILQEVWAVNEQHVRENTSEVEVYYCVTG